MLELYPIILSLQLAAITTIILFVIGVPMAYWLSKSKSKLKPVIEAIISMPLVLPPTVIGFYLLLLFSPNTGIGAFIKDAFHIQFTFSFLGLIIGSVIYSLPFMIYPIYSGLSNLPTSLKESSYVLGKSEWMTLRHVLLPNIKTSIVSAIVLTFAHTIGEFGVVLMIGGNIPEKTRVASIAIYDEVEALNYSAAHQYSIVLFIICFTILLLISIFNRNTRQLIK